MSEDRKATDILLSIEEKVEKILAYVQNLDLNSKIQTERNRILGEKLDLLLAGKPVAMQPAIPPKSSVVVSTPDKSIVGLPVPPKSPFLVAPDLKERVQQAIKEAELDQKLEQEIQVEKSPTGFKRTQPKPVDASKPVIVQQSVVYESDGKKMYMANVEIFDVTLKLVKQVRTNQTGKWMAPLIPGEYTVKISKAGTPLKSEVSTQFNITVKNTDSTIELPLKKV